MHRCAVSIAVNVSQSCGALRACILGTFSHATCYPIGFASWTGQQKVCMSIPSKLYRRQEHFRVMAKLSGQRQPITCTLRAWFLGRFRIRPVTQSTFVSWTGQQRGTGQGARRCIHRMESGKLLSIATHPDGLAGGLAWFLGADIDDVQNMLRSKGLAD